MAIQDEEVPEDIRLNQATTESVSNGSASERLNLSEDETAVFETDSLSEEDRRSSLTYPVVGIGASAGGLQAFQELLRNLNPNTGMAFVLVTRRPSLI